MNRREFFKNIGKAAPLIVVPKAAKLYWGKPTKKAVIIAFGLERYNNDWVNTNMWSDGSLTIDRDGKQVTVERARASLWGIVHDIEGRKIRMEHIPQGDVYIPADYDKVHQPVDGEIFRLL
jgi:hypothetical protein